MSNNCPSCGKPFVPGAKFCRGCGNPLAHLSPGREAGQKCSSCGTANRVGAKFCKSCGHAFETQAATSPLPEKAPEAGDQVQTSASEKPVRDAVGVPAATPRPAEAIPKTKAEKVCSSCGAEQPISKAFCRQCGTRLEPTPGKSPEQAASPTTSATKVGSAAPVNGSEKAVTTHCSGCRAEVALGKKFCSVCGTPIRANEGSETTAPSAAPTSSEPLGTEPASSGTGANTPMMPTESVNDGNLEKGAVPGVEAAEPEPVRCANCGTELVAGKKFCRSCGTPVKELDSRATTPGMPANERGTGQTDVAAPGAEPVSPARSAVEPASGPAVPTLTRSAAEPLSSPAVAGRWGPARIAAAIAGCVILLGGGGYLAYRHFATGKASSPAPQVATNVPSSPAPASSAMQAPAPATAPQSNEPSQLNDESASNVVPAAALPRASTPLSTSRPPSPSAPANPPGTNGLGVGAAGVAGTAIPTPATRVASSASPAPAATSNASSGIAAPATTTPDESAGGVAGPAIVIPRPAPAPAPATNQPPTNAPPAAAPVQAPRPVQPAIPSSGTLIWSGRLEKNVVVTIRGDSASSGTLRGQLPGVPVIIQVYPNDIGVAEFPGPQNGWRKVVLRSTKNRNVVVRIHWTTLQQ